MTPAIGASDWAAPRQLHGPGSADRRIRPDAGITLVRDWPQRTALIVGPAPGTQIVGALQRLGFTSVVARTDKALEVAADAGPFTFLLITPAALGPTGGSALVRALRNHSPAARVILLGAHDDFAPEALVEALRSGASDLVDPRDLSALAAMIDGQLRLAGHRRERVLAIGAHPDDIEIGCAGTLLDHRRRGDRLSLLTLSRGAAGGNQQARVAESTAAAERLGAQLLFGDLPDTEIDAGVETIKLIEDVVRQVDPTIVYVHTIHDNHQDHRAVHTATLSATRGVPQVFAYQSPSATNDYQPSKFVAVDEVIVTKVEVLSLFASQGERSYLEPELVIAGARYWARHLAPRARYAEPFEVVRSLRSPMSVPAADTVRPAERDRAVASVIQLPDTNRGSGRPS